MKKLYLAFFTLFISQVLLAQDANLLLKKYPGLKDAKAKINLLNEVARAYMMDGDKDSLATMYGQKSIDIANQTRNNRIIAWSHLLNGRRWLSLGGSNEISRLKQGADELNQALTLAKQNSYPDIEADACLQMVIYNRSSRINNSAKAADYITQAQSILATNPNDSLSTVAYRYQGSLFYAKGDEVNAFRNYSNALTIADRTGNKVLISDSYQSLGSFYMGLEDYDKAADYMIKAYNIKAENNLITAPEHIYIMAAIGNIYGLKKNYAQARKYYWLMYNTAKKLHLHEIIVNQPLFFVEQSYFDEGNFKELRKYLNDPKLNKIIQQYGQEYMMDYYRGAMYDRLKQRDSANYYYGKVIKPAEQSAAPPTLISIYTDYGFWLIKTGDTKTGLQWMEKAKAVTVKLNSLTYLTYTYHALDSAYAKTGFKSQAYDYRVLYDKYNDSLKNEGKARQLTLAEVNAESQRLKIRQQKEEEALRKKHNLQYMGITAAIASIFVILVLLGFFSTTASIIRGLGFFAFIFFFEFITLLFDHVIHEWTHGEPLKIMAIKIVFVALLVPVHHFVEEKVIHHLIHRKKIRLGKKASKKAVDLHGDVSTEAIS